MRVAIASLRFAPGHIAHLRAYRELFSALGCTVELFLDKGYKGFVEESPDVVFLTSVNNILAWKPDVVLSYNIANENVDMARRCRQSNIPFFYVLHEPWDSFKELMSLGKRMPRRVAANIVNYLTSHYAHKVILASENGKNKYLKYMKGCNKNYAVFPLIFCDDFDPSLEIARRFFSFIGGFTEPRACSAFLGFVKKKKKKSLGIYFCIATRNTIDGYLNDPVLQKAVGDGWLSIYAGKPMSTDEINKHYRESICSWNAYKMSTQSGVLPNALMQGSPVLVTDRGDSADIVTEKKQGCFVSLPLQNDDIEEAFEYIKAHADDMSKAARDTFQKNYEYKVYLDKAKEVYEIK